MGAPMAGHLTAAGHQVSVYNRTRAKADAWGERHGGTAADSPAEAAAGAEAVIACVGNDSDVEQVTIGPGGAFEAMAAGALWIDHSTVSASLARRLADEAEHRGLLAVDAPVSGGQAGAESGKLAAMCGGSEPAFARAEPLISAYCARIVRIGPAGSGQLAKMVNQIAIAGLVEGLAEAVHFTKAAGLNPQKVFDAISAGAASSWQMHNRWQTMVAGEFEFGFAIDWMRKDLGLTLDEARRNGARLPVTALVDQFYAELQAAGGGRLDTSSLAKRYEAPVDRSGVSSDI